MLSTKKLMKIATKWQRQLKLEEKRTLLQRSKSFINSNTSPAMADKDHFVVCTMDNRRLVIPVPYLYSDIFRELLRMSEEEFGLPKDGLIMFPCDSFFLEYVVSTSCRSLSSSLHQGLWNKHVLVSNWIIVQNYIFEIVQKVFGINKKFQYLCTTFCK